VDANPWKSVAFWDIEQEDFPKLINQKHAIYIVKMGNDTDSITRVTPSRKW
jgi:hypothetical protein